MFTISPLLTIIVALFGHALSQCPTPSHIPSGCNYNCSDSRLTCSGAFPSQLTITQCTDPLTLSLVVNMEGPLTQEYLVRGSDDVSTCNNVGDLQITATYSRNTTHLTFMVGITYSSYCLVMQLCHSTGDGCPSSRHCCCHYSICYSASHTTFVHVSVHGNCCQQFSVTPAKSNSFELQLHSR